MYSYAELTDEIFYVQIFANCHKTRGMETVPKKLQYLTSMANLQFPFVHPTRHIRQVMAGCINISVALVLVSDKDNNS